jgi:RNA polymerase sigma-70 factor (ECF subfamily)
MSLDLAGCSDGELAALALAGRQAAYGELMRRHREPAYRLIRGHIGDADAALDVTQQTFLAAFSALARYDGARPFRIWIARIAINKCHDWARRRAVRRILSFALPIEAANATADEAATPEAMLSDRQELRRAMAAIATLPASLKESLILRTIEGLSQAETAQVLGISEKAVETRVYRARARLAESLRD